MEMVKFYTQKMKELYSLAEKCSSDKAQVRGYYDQGFGAIDFCAEWMHFAGVDDDAIASLWSMWEGYLEKFNQLLEK